MIDKFKYTREQIEVFRRRCHLSRDVELSMPVAKIIRQLLDEHKILCEALLNINEELEYDLSNGRVAIDIARNTLNEVTK